MNRAWMVGLVALGTGAIGCSGMPRRDDGPIGFRPGSARSSANAPPQTQVMLPPERPGAAAADPFAAAQANADRAGAGLARYFPTLHRTAPAGSTSVASLSNGARPSWFGLRKAKPAQAYATDARMKPGQVGPEPTLLPIALQVPTRSTDRDVRVASAEGPATAPADGLDLPAPASEVTPSPSAPESTPSPSAASPDGLPTPAAPAIDPKAAGEAEGTKPAASGTPPDPTIAPEATDPPGATPTPRRPDLGVDPIRVDRPASTPAESTRATSAAPPAEPIRVAQAVPPAPKIPTTPDSSPGASATIDPTKPLTLPDPTLPASYGTGRPTQPQTPAIAPSASGQGHVHPTGQVRPSAQSPAPALTKADKCWLKARFKKLTHRVGSRFALASPQSGSAR